MINYGKTMLSAYTSIEGVITQIENLIKTRARNSFYLRENTLGLANQLLRLGEIRKDLFELKELVEDVLASMSEEDRELISYKYFGYMPSNENFDHTSRNYFRKQVRALSRFSNKLEAMGYDGNWFTKKYLKIAFIAGVYQKTVLEEGKKHVR